MADTAQNIKELEISKANDVNSVPESISDIEVTADGKNLKQIKCQRCPSTILVSGTATLVTNEVYTKLNALNCIIYSILCV